MSDGIYSSFAKVYDSLNASYDYCSLATFLSNEIKKFEKTQTSLVLDLGCGTGKITFALREKGYDMTGVDFSDDMLSFAREECINKNINDILWLCQDMRAFELYGTVDACVCTLDCINYLTKFDDVKKCFSLVHNYLIPDGLFIFDINTPYRFENVYANNDYILEDGNALLAWRNNYNPKSKICNFYLSVFAENKNGTYTRFDEVQKEKCYSKKQIEAALISCGFEILAEYGDINLKKCDNDDEKWYFVARNIK